MAVPEGDRVVPVINKISGNFNKVIATQDWHPRGHISFAGTHKKELYQTIETEGVVQVLWPDHCVQGSRGADLHKDLNQKPIDLIIRKGTDPNLDSYSAFLENDKKTSTGLEYYLKGLNIMEIYLCGLAVDYCVYFSALDACRMEFKTFVILDASIGVDVPEKNIKKTIDDMKNKGIFIIGHNQL